MKVFVAAGALVAAGSLVSCGSAVGLGNTENHLAAVKLQTGSKAEIKKTTVQVFSREGFQYQYADGDTLKFRKSGGDMANLMFGRFNTPGVYAEPEIEVVDYGGGVHWLFCNVYMREHSDSELLDANWKVRQAGSHGYKMLLLKVKKHVESK